MLPALHGTLVSEYFAEHLLADRFAGRLGESRRDSARKTLDRIRRSCAALGPASSIRSVLDVGAAALAGMLGFRVAQVAPFARTAHGRHQAPAIADDVSALSAILAADDARVAMLVVAWGESLDAAWRDSVRAGIELDARWCMLFNARQVRLVDSSRSYGREHLEFDLEAACEDGPSFDLMWALLRAEAFAPSQAEAWNVQAGTTLLDQILALSAAHAVGVCRSLREGVLDALAALMEGLAGTRGNVAASALFEQSLTIIYRILFLLFAEARRLLPTWHRIYRDAYSIETLRAVVERHGSGAAVGAWETLQAISRLAHRGCRAGSLVVTPFNGRLFSPGRTPLAESRRVDDRVASRVITALSTQDRGAGAGRARIAYRDLGVEQLGAVYESVLDYEPRIEKVVVRSPNSEVRRHRRRVVLEKGSGRRKATGSFYTPQSLTGYMVRRTLHPLVSGATSEEILGLRIVDPAMGSGAFLVAACHYLAARYERALVAEGRRHASEVDDHDRAMFRRAVAQRCLFGVDLNPMAVQLARLSLWLATLAADCPLTFLDHHLAAGDSLVGADPLDVVRHPSSARTARERDGTAAQPGLFDLRQLQADLERALPERLRIGIEPGDTLAAVQGKERAMQRLSARDGPLARWKEASDLWCACWFWGRADRPGRGVYRDLMEAVVGRSACLPPASVRSLIEHARAVASVRRFFHWQIEFPEAFFDADGRCRADPGFDAVIGNPPWDMLRADSGDGAEAADDKKYDRGLVEFARRSGLYTARSDGHPNRFQLFVERAFRLVRPGGRVGLVAPWGLLADRGCASLRRLLFDGADTDSLVGLDNTKAIFPIHRSVRFALVTATAGRPTTRTACRLGEKEIAALDRLPDTDGAFAGAADPDARAPYPLVLSPVLLRRLSGDDLAVPDIRSPLDLEVLERASASFPRLSASEGWGAHFGRELNASDDREHFEEMREDQGSKNGGIGSDRWLPILEGKHIEPFVARTAGARFRIRTSVAARLLAGNPAFGRARLAYRDVASATNRVTLIAAVLPPGCVTTHTLFCLRTALDQDAQWLLCGVMNSYVANYLVRLRVTTHVSAGIVEHLPVPFVSTGDRAAAEIVMVARQLAARFPGACDDRLQALVARLYDLTPRQFSHILATFPLVDRARRDGALAELSRLRPDVA